MRVLMIVCTVLTASLTAFLLGYVMIKGVPHITWELLTTKPSYLENRIGILPDILNTVYIVTATLFIVLPLGVGAAIYLTEYARNKKVTAVIEYASETLSGIPSIIYGLVGMLLFSNNFGTSLLAGALTLVIMNLPTVMRTAQESLKTVPAVIRNYTDKQVKEISIIENLQREDLNPVEAARAIKELMDEYGLTQDAVAERIGKSRPSVANTLRLLSLYPDVLKMVEDGKLSAGHARCLVVVEDKNNQIKLANAVVQRNLSVRDLEKAVKNLENPQKRQIVSQEQSLELKELIIQMQKTFATKVTAIGNDNKGRIYIDYYTRDDLDRIAELLDLLNKKEMTLQDLQNFNRRQGK